MEGRTRYRGEDDLKNTASWINNALSKNKDILAKETLGSCLEDYMKDMNIEIIEEKEYFIINLDPISGEGHDFSFKLDKKTKLISDMVVGFIEPEPMEEKI